MAARDAILERFCGWEVPATVCPKMGRREFVMLYISNAVSGAMVLGLIPVGEEITVKWSHPTTEQVKEIINNAPEDGVESTVGHKDVANVMSVMLGIEVPWNRISLRLKKGDVLIWAQMVGPRLPEGATSLPEGTTLEWMMITL